MSLVSTTWEIRKAKIGQRRNGPGKTSPEAAARRSLAPWRRRDPLTVQIVFRGGSECWYELRARNCVWRVPGWLDIESVMADIYNDI